MKGLGNIEKGLSKFGNSRISNRDILRKQKKGTYVIQTSQPEYNDKSHLFKSTWSEEKRNFFFSS